MMQRSPYSAYDEYYKSVLETINRRCGLTGPTDILEVPVDMPVEKEPICLSDLTYTTVNGDTYTSIAVANSVSSAALYIGNQHLIRWCSSIKAGLKLCLPLPCERTYVVQPSDNCTSIEYAFSLKYGDVRKYNPWVSYDCDNIQHASQIYGTNICLSPQGGEHTTDKTGRGSTTPSTSDGHVPNAVPPPANAILANGTTTNCGRWHEATPDESCVAICVQDSITHDLFVEVNPSLDPVDCTGSLQVGKTYCTGPTYTWNAPPIEDEAMPASSATP
jgi:LysM repeat protein